MPSAEKQKKLEQMSGSIAQPPIPQVPDLPPFLREKYPQYAGQMDAYRQQWVEFFKKAGTVAN